MACYMFPIHKYMFIGLFSFVNLWSIFVRFALPLAPRLSRSSLSLTLVPSRRSTTRTCCAVTRSSTTSTGRRTTRCTTSTSPATCVAASLPPYFPPPLLERALTLSLLSPSLAVRPVLHLGRQGVQLVPRPGKGRRPARRHPLGPYQQPRDRLGARTARHGPGTGQARHRDALALADARRRTVGAPAHGSTGRRRARDEARRLWARQRDRARPRRQRTQQRRVVVERELVGRRGCEREEGGGPGSGGDGCGGTTEAGGFEGAQVGARGWLV